MKTLWSASMFQPLSILELCCVVPLPLTKSDRIGHNDKSRAVALTVSSEPVSATQGFSDSLSYSRLSWLNSKYAIDDEVVAPYTPLQVDGTMSSLTQQKPRQTVSL